MSAQEQADFNRRLFTVAEAADHCRVSKSLIFKLIREGRLVPIKLGNRTIITGAAIERLLSEPAV